MYNKKFTFLMLGLLSTSSIGSELNTAGDNDVNDEQEYTEYSNAYNDNGEIILSVYLDEIKLADAMFSLVHDDTVLFPLSELFSVLEFPIFVDPDSGESNGWFINPERKFDLDIKNNQVTVSGEKYLLDKSDVVFFENDVFISGLQLEEWFPLSFNTDLRAQSLVITADEKLPMQLAKDRELYQNNRSSHAVIYGSTLEPKVPHYKILDWPTISTKFNATKSGQSGSKSEYRVTAFGDLAGLNGVISIGGDTEESIEHLYLTLGRRDASRRLFGPLKISEFQIGDTSSSTRGLIGGAAAGLGITFSNNYLFPRYYRDRTDLKGRLDSNYEVELYVNNLYLSVFRENGQKTYEFENVPLSRGQNKVRLEFYGPNGERETEEKNIYNDQNSGRFGEFTYSGALVDEGSGFYKEIEGDNVERSLTSVFNFSINLGGRSVVDVMLLDRGDGLSHNYAINGAFSKYHIQAELGVDQDGDAAYSFSLNDYYSKHSKSVRFEFYNRGFSGDGQPTAEDSWSMNASISKSSSYFTDRSSSWSVDAAYIGNDAVGLETSSLNWYYSYYKRNLNYSFYHSYRKNIVSDDTTGEGSVNVGLSSGGIKKISNRLSVNYDFYPDFYYSDISYGLSLSSSNEWSASARISYDNELGKYTYSIGGERLFDKLSTSLSFTKEIKGDYSVNLGLSFSAARQPGEVFPRFSKLGAESAPRVSVLVFKDSNSSGTREVDEVGLEGLQVRVNGLGTSYYTGTSGYALVEGLAADRSYDISIVDGSITDPSYRAIAPEFGVVPRQGRLPIVYIPVVPTGEVEGVVNFQSKGKMVGAANVKVVIKRINDDAKSTPEVFTEYDGMFNLAGLPLGDYQIELDSEVLVAAGLISSPKSRLITLSEDNSLIESINFVIEKN